MMQPSPIKLIVGLRNPGSAYEQTRHNAGAWFLQHLAQRQGLQFKSEKKLQAELSEISLNSQRSFLLLPLTYMNLSGQPVLAAAQFYRIAPEEILIVHDDLDLEPGRVKLKTGGGHGGHNGLRDLINKLGNGFHRLRIGIGHPGHRDLVHDYVLGKPNTQDRLAIYDAIDRALAIMPLLGSGDLAQAMSRINA